MFRRLFICRSFATASNELLGPGIYYIATPIGNMSDISERALQVLRGADYICAEDTRHSIHLLRHFKIPPKQLISHHEHNYKEKIPHILSLLKNHKSVAVVTDAGTPGISDPGMQLADACYREGITPMSIPGPSAVIAALSICGFHASPFTFFGFIPTKSKSRKGMLKQIAACHHAAVIYEAPHRIIDTISDLNDLHTNRMCCCCREITKVHEEIRRGTLREILMWLKAKHESDIGVRGEFTVVLAPISGEDEADAVLQAVSEELVAQRDTGVSRSAAVRAVAEIFAHRNIKKSLIYDLALQMPWGGET